MSLTNMTQRWMMRLEGRDSSDSSFYTRRSQVHGQEQKLGLTPRLRLGLMDLFPLVHRILARFAGFCACYDHL
jgi:hypothetical protein